MIKIKLGKCWYRNGERGEVVGVLNNEVVSRQKVGDFYEYHSHKPDGCRYTVDSMESYDIVSQSALNGDASNPNKVPCSELTQDDFDLLRSDPSRLEFWAVPYRRWVKAMGGSLGRSTCVIYRLRPQPAELEGGEPNSQLETIGTDSSLSSDDAKWLCALAEQIDDNGMHAKAIYLSAMVANAKSATYPKAEREGGEG